MSLITVSVKILQQFLINIYLLQNSFSIIDIFSSFIHFPEII